MKHQNMVSWDEGLRVWRIAGMAAREVTCPLCAMPMLRYENPSRWLCFNIKLHDKVMNDSDDRLG